MTDTISVKAIDYGKKYQQAVLGMVREILTEVAEQGLPGEHFFYLTFDSQAEGVEMSQVLLDGYPESMTIVLQNQFWNLAVDDEAFYVTLRFGGVPEALRVPWTSLLSFVDPSVEFGLELRPRTEPAREKVLDENGLNDGESVDSGGEDEPQADRVEPSDSNREAEDSRQRRPRGAGDVVSFEEFKKR